jgi:hypothetical protein
MSVFTHKLAGIVFRSECDIESVSFQSGPFRQFLTDDSPPDVCHRIGGIGQETLTLPPLTKDERERISHCGGVPHIGRGTLLLPPVIVQGTEERVSFRGAGSHDGFDLPLLRSPLVRRRLDACLSHPEQVSLALHLFSVTIADYLDRTLDIFYPLERRGTLAEHWGDGGLRRMFTTFLPAFSAVMVHSSALVRNGRAALFLSADDGGKSTVLKHSVGGDLLCDDRNILRGESGDFFVYATPWGRVTNASARARIGGLFLLEKAPSFELLPASPRDVLQFLWNEHLPHWDSLPGDLRVRAFEVLYCACHKAPAYRMRFPKDHIDWDAIDAAMVR